MMKMLEFHSDIFNDLPYTKDIDTPIVLPYNLKELMQMDEITHIAVIQISGMTNEDVDTTATLSAGFTNKADAIVWCGRQIQAAHGGDVLEKDFCLADDTDILDVEVTHVASEDGPTNAFIIKVGEVIADG